MGKSSRDKGQRGEREVAQRFRDYGFAETERSGAEGQKNGDLAYVPDYTEIRFRETLNIPGWVRECAEKAGERNWALVFRRTREPWSVCISLDRYLELLVKEEPDGS